MRFDPHLNDPWRLTALDVSRLVRGRRVSATEVTRSVLERLDAVNPALNAVVAEMPDEALREARRVDDAIARGESPGILAGVPVTVKVNVDQAGHATTNGLRLQRDLVARADSPVVANLRKAGAVIVGRTNAPAFSLRWFTRNSLHGHTLNPRGRGLTPGGSSGGAAAAVAAGIGAVAHGTDIGGSIRYPAYACGVHGLRPTLGRVPACNLSAPDRHLGAQLMAVSGPIARSVADLEIALEAMAAEDPRDPWWTPAPLARPRPPRRAALVVEPDGLKTAPEVARALRDAAARLESAGWSVAEVECPGLREPARLQAALWMSEFRRVGGVEAIDREGDPDASFVYRQLDALCPEQDVNSFLDVLKTRVTLMRAWQQFLAEYPLMLCPVSAEPPFSDLLDVESELAFKRVVKAQLTQVGLPFLGLPALAVGVGMADGTPLGVQLVAARYREDVLIDAGKTIEAGGAPPSPIDPVPSRKPTSAQAPTATVVESSPRGRP